MPTRPIRLVLVPFHLARRGEDVGNGPLALLQAGVPAALGRAGAAVAITQVELGASAIDGDEASAFRALAGVAGTVEVHLHLDLDLDLDVLHDSLGPVNDSGAGAGAGAALDVLQLIGRRATGP